MDEIVSDRRHADKPRGQISTPGRASHLSVTPSNGANAPHNSATSAIGVPSSSTQAWASNDPVSRRTPIRMTALSRPAAMSSSWSARDRTRHAESPGSHRSARSTATPHRSPHFRSSGDSGRDAGADASSADAGTTRPPTRSPIGRSATALRARVTAPSAAPTSRAARSFRATHLLTPERPRQCQRRETRPRGQPGARERDT